MRACFAGHDEAVPPVGVRAHPLVFGEQVALHSAAGRRIEESGVDDVHGVFFFSNGEYRGVAVMRPVSADSVPYVDNHLQDATSGVTWRLQPPSLFVPAPHGRRPRAAIKAVDAKVIAWRRDFHQHPELSNREVRTAKIVAEHLRKLGLEVRDRHRPTGVVGLLRTGKPGPTIALRADMDALPVIERTDVPFRSTAKSNYRGEEVGVMHACGHDSHTAVLMGVAEVLVEAQGANCAATCCSCSSPRRKARLPAKRAARR